MYYGGGSIFNSLPIRGLADVSVFFFFGSGPIYAEHYGVRINNIILLSTPYGAQSTISILGGIYTEISQNNESSCLTLVALVHCVLRETSLSLDPQKPHFRLKAYSCSNLHWPVRSSAVPPL